jgi:hypothetical protein
MNKLSGLGEAAQLAQVISGKNSIFSSNRNWLDENKSINSINEAMAKPSSSLGTVALAGLGLGLARGIGAMFGLNSQEQNNLESKSMFMAMNKTAAEKHEEAKHIAFRTGFLKAAMDSGYFEKTSASLFNLLTGPVMTAAGLSLAAGGAAGTLAGGADSADETDEDIAKMHAEKLLLKQQLTELQADRKNSILREVLDKKRKRRI